MPQAAVAAAPQIHRVVAAREVLMYPNQPRHRRADVRANDLRRDRGVVGFAECPADVVEQSRQHDVIAGAGALRARRSLKRVGQLVDCVPVGEVRQRRQELLHLVGGPVLVDALSSTMARQSSAVAGSIRVNGTDR
jgi:hypothetical protein